MRKKEKSQRIPVPEDPVQSFSMTVHLMAMNLGISKMPQLSNYVDNLIEACARYSFEQQHPVPMRKKEDKEKRAFIVMFQARYLQLTDFEYTRGVTGIDVKLIKQVSNTLSENSFTVGEYLEWIFDVFLEENNKFCPPVIKVMCSGFILDKFLFEHKDKIRKRQKDDIRQKDGMAFLNRGKILMRCAKEKGDTKKQEDVRNLMVGYRDNKILFGEFRQKIEEFEKEAEEVK